MEVNTHASETSIQDAYRHFFASGVSFSHIKDSVITDRLYPRSTEALGVPGRSMAWKLFLAKHEPLQASSPPRAASLLESLRESRRKYTQLLSDKSRAPDGSHDGGTAKPSSPSLQHTADATHNLTFNNPLSLHNEVRDISLDEFAKWIMISPHQNPWNEWFASIELRKIISQDVERTFPEILFFREHQVQEQLTNILFVYSVTHSSIGYRQGMHELLAPLYHAVNFDSISEGNTTHSINVELQELCSRKWVAADAWSLFDAVMNGVSVWYEWQESDPMKARKDPHSPLSGHVHFIVPEGQNGIQPYVAPIVRTCNRIQNDLLKKCDPALWRSMQSAGIEPQIYGIRWLRLLFTREFEMSDALKLWDGLFTCDPTLALAEWVCVAMLIRIRSELISADYSTQLTTLLRYPSPPENGFDGGPHHASLLLQQALSLQMSPVPATAASIMMENRTLLNIPIDVPGPAQSPSKRRAVNRQSGFTTMRPSTYGEHTQSGLGHSRQASSPPLGIPEMFTRGLLERGESLGINKTLMSAVTEIRKNIPDISASLSRTSAQALSSFPLEDEKPATERPPWEPRSRFEMEHEIADLRGRNKRLGESLGWIVDALLQDESNIEDADRLKRQKREALESLSYIRDVLMNDTLVLEIDRLTGEEETLKRKLRKEHRVEEATPIAMVAPPKPASVIDSRSRHSVDRQRTRSPPVSYSVPVDGVRPVQRAPWNYTRSSFTSASVEGGSLPRKPPPTSTGSGEKLRNQDPLGAL